MGRGQSACTSVILLVGRIWWWYSLLGLGLAHLKVALSARGRPSWCHCILFSILHLAWTKRLWHVCLQKVKFCCSRRISRGKTFLIYHSIVHAKYSQETESREQERFGRSTEQDHVVLTGGLRTQVSVEAAGS